MLRRIAAAGHSHAPGGERKNPPDLIGVWRGSDNPSARQLRAPPRAPDGDLAGGTGAQEAGSPGVHGRQDSRGAAGCQASRSASQVVVDPSAQGASAAGETHARDRAPSPSASPWAPRMDHGRLPWHRRLTSRWGAPASRVPVDTLQCPGSGRTGRPGMRVVRLGRLDGRGLPRVPQARIAHARALLAPDPRADPGCVPEGGAQAHDSASCSVRSASRPTRPARASTEVPWLKIIAPCWTPFGWLT